MATDHGADPLRVALVGIDGSGKTSVARLVRERATDRRWVATHLINPHEIPDGPLSDLSRDLQALSHAADELGSYELKLAAFYLQLCTYAPIEGFLVDAYDPDIVFADRHPLVDSLVYLPLYGRAARSDRRRTDPGAPELRRRLERTRAGAYEAIADWTAVQARRLGYATDPWSLGREMLGIHDQPLERLLAEFSARFRTRLPDIVVLLDIDVGDALGRSAARDGSRELHETRARLEQIQAGYERVLARLADLDPSVAVRRVVNGDCSAHEALDRVLDCVSGEVRGG